ncbi:lysylphosphatidylglycerol synthase transmembrane domain-containing protein [Candidatus Riflebacteria bacterium]
MGRKVKIFFSLFISAFFLYIAFKDLPFDKFKEALTRYNIFFAIPALCILVIEMSVRAYRWKLILSDSEKVQPQYLHVMSATWLCYLFNSIFPARAGDLIRCHILHKDEPQYSRSQIFGTVILERTLDGLSLVAVLFITIIFVPQIDERIRYVARLSFIIYILITFILILLYFKEQKVRQWVEFFIHPFPEFLKERVLRLISLVTSGFHCVSNPKQMLKIVLVNTVLWCMMICSHTVWLCGIPVLLDSYFKTALTYLGAAGAAVMIPSAPGALGTYHYFTSYVLKLFSIPQEIAVSTATLIHGIPYLFVCTVGCVVLLYKGIRPGELETDEGIEKQENMDTVAESAI